MDKLKLTIFISLVIEVLIGWLIQQSSPPTYSNPAIINRPGIINTTIPHNGYELTVIKTN